MKLTGTIRGLLALVAFLLLWAAAPSAASAQATPYGGGNTVLAAGDVYGRRGPLYGTTYPSKICGKLWSGISNTLFCWCELPIEINREIQSTDPFSGFFVGLGKGLWYTGRRLVLGVVDIVTFPFNIYGNNYQSKQRTEFPFIDEVE